MPSTLKPDFCVIGTDPGGLAVAMGAAMFGASVVLVDTGMPASDPSRVRAVALSAAARAMHMAGVTDRLGVNRGAEADQRKIERHVRAAVEALAPNEAAGRLTALGVHVLRGSTHFAGRSSVVVGDVTVRARRYVIATGGTSAVPDLPGLRDVDFHTVETIFSVVKCPGHLVILGAQRAGCEAAQAWRRLGAEVTLIDTQGVLRDEDEELAGFVTRRLRAEGVMVREATSVTRLERRGKTGVRVHIERDGTAGSLDATHLLVAGPRTPNLAGLGLEAARIRADEYGIRVDDGLRTSNRRVYAVGAAAGQPAGAADYHASLLLRRLLFRKASNTRAEIVPRVVLTDPEIASVGITEGEARSSRLSHTILRWPLSENARAQAERETDGMVKLIVGKGGEIFGAGIAGRSASEAINVFALAASAGLRLGDIAAYVPVDLATAEAGKRAAVTYLANTVRSPIARLASRLLRRLG